MIGAGNVAYHLSVYFKENGFNIIQIFSKNLENAKALGNKIDSDFTNEEALISSEADIYIVAIKDDAIADLVTKIPQLKNKLIAHTSGSVGLEILNKLSNRAAVFYPLQTFSKDKNVDFQNIPFCIEASNSEDLELLKTLASEISQKVFSINSEQRAAIHKAAVFACNFSNYMYIIAEKILKENNVDFSILHPLITETARKACLNSPYFSQTGPAKRNDKLVIKKHLSSLSNDELEIYQLLTNQIIKTYNNE
jgi:predicted short-subunit dehydrogenase-like oxidoreductase (DUF2520 family)